MTAEELLKRWSCSCEETIVVTFFVSPYFSLWQLNGIANSLENIETELHEISKQLKRIAEKDDKP